MGLFGTNQGDQHAEGVLAGGDRDLCHQVRALGG
jgi:hypothetical protein